MYCSGNDLPLKGEFYPLNAIGNPDGSIVESKRTISYLGSCLNDSGAATGPESSQCLAKGTLSKRGRVRRHSNMNTQQKINIIQVCVALKLLH